MNRKTQAFRKLTGYAMPLAVVAFLFSSCNKEPVSMPNPSTSTAIKDAGLKRQIWDMGQKVPSVVIYNRTMNEILVFSPAKDGSRSFSFTTAPASGISFASSNGGQWVWTEDGGMVVLTEPQAGLGAGGGTVSAGNTTLDINLAVCFAVGDDALGGGLFGPDMGEVAGVIGISGDFDALQNGDFSDGESDPFQYFHGFAYYFVYADNLSNTSYDVLNWIDDLNNDDLDNFSFAFIISFQNDGGIYLSKDGAITVNDGTMEFNNGHYYAVEGVGFFDDDEDSDASYSVVSGYGAMGCQ